jgi:hypothetical protein
MANGLLSELRKIAESSKDIPQEAVNRLLLSAVADVVFKLDRQSELEEAKTKAFDCTLSDIKAGTEVLSDRIDGINRDLTGKVNNLNQQMVETNSKLTILTTDLLSLRTNPVVAAGNFGIRHPKLTMAITVVLTVSLVVLLRSQAFIILVLTMAGVPGEAIKQILALLAAS